MESIGCIFCLTAADNSDPVVIRESGWEGRQCQHCRLIYISPRPSLSEIRNIYSLDSARTDSGTLNTNASHRRLCATHSIRLLKRFAHGGDLLEIGPGAGLFLQEASQRGFQPFGIELNPVQAADIKAQGFSCDTRSLSEAFPGKQFDVIYHCDVTSHFHDPIAEFRTMAERLRPDGILMFETGNFGDMSQRWYREIRSFQYPDHLFFLSAGNIPVLLKRSGFSLLSLHHYSCLLELLLSRPPKKRERSSPVTETLNSIASFKRRAKSFVRFALTYYVGAINPTSSVPQTMIVIARKATTP